MKKTVVGILIAIILCSGCGSGNTEENIEKELQAMEETQEAELTQPESNEEQMSEAEKSSKTESEDKLVPEQSAASVSADEPNKKIEETTSIRHDSIDQLEIQGRTQEETELIHKILSEDKEEFQEFLTTDWEYPREREKIYIGGYDFTGDGIDEIIVSEFYVNLSAPLTYNYVYNQDGKKVLEFVGGGEDEIIVDWDGEGTFLLHTMNHYSSHNDADIYTEIKYENDALTEKVILMEWDCRYDVDRRFDGDEGKEGYYIFKDFTKEEEEKLWYGTFGVSELAKIKESFKEGEEPEAYRKLFREKRTDPNYFSAISMIAYSEEDGFVELIEVLTYHFTQDGRKVLGWKLQPK